MKQFQRILCGCTAMFCIAILTSFTAEAQSTDFNGSANLATSVNGIAPADLASQISGTIGEFEHVSSTVQRAPLYAADIVNVAFRGDTHPNTSQSYVELRGEGATLWPARIYIYHLLRLCCWNGLNFCCTTYLPVCFRSIDIYNQSDIFTTPTTLSLEQTAHFPSTASSTIYTIRANGFSTITIDPLQ